MFFHGWDNYIRFAYPEDEVWSELSKSIFMAYSWISLVESNVV